MRSLILSIIVVASTGCKFVTQPESMHTTVISPESKPTNFYTTDSTFFKLKVKEDKYEIDFLKNVSVINNLSGLDSFFQKNQKLINKEKVVVTNFDTSDYNLKGLLKKYGLTYFRLNVEE